MVKIRFANNVILHVTLAMVQVHRIVQHVRLINRLLEIAVSVLMVILVAIKFVHNAISHAKLVPFQVAYLVLKLEL